MELVLVADVGGTNTRFALAERNELNPGERPSVFEFWKTPGDDHDDFHDAVEAYLNRTGAKPSRAVFAVAGPVIDNSVKFTNRDWKINGAELGDHLEMHSVELINDFVAMARSAPLLTHEEYTTIRDGQAAPDTPMVVGGPGTGYGLATLIPFGEDYLVVGGEGGHQAFSPRDDYEIELLKRLQVQHGYVSTERVAAGMAFDDVLAATFDIFARSPETLTPADVLKLADQGDQMCMAFCQMRANVTMTALGDAALAAAALGGAWLAGGVSVRLQRFLQSDEAIERFSGRGRMTDLMKDIPINMITSDEAALIGATGYRRLN